MSNHRKFICLLLHFHIALHCRLSLRVFKIVEIFDIAGKTTIKSCPMSDQKLMTNSNLNRETDSVIIMLSQHLKLA